MNHCMPWQLLLGKIRWRCLDQLDSHHCQDSLSRLHFQLAFGRVIHTYLLASKIATTLSRSMIYQGTGTKEYSAEWSREYKKNRQTEMGGKQKIKGSVIKKEMISPRGNAKHHKQHFKGAWQSPRREICWDRPQKQQAGLEQCQFMIDSPGSTDKFAGVGVS